VLLTTTRRRIATAELVLGGLLILAAAGLAAWCGWSLPRNGVMTAHGLETPACNWGTLILRGAAFASGLFMCAVGLLSRFAADNGVVWWSLQLSAVTALVVVTIAGA
jgi:hypothetical protein